MHLSQREFHGGRGLRRNLPEFSIRNRNVERPEPRVEISVAMGTGYDWVAAIARLPSLPCPFKPERSLPASAGPFEPNRSSPTSTVSNRA